MCLGSGEHACDTIDHLLLWGCSNVSKKRQNNIKDGQFLKLHKILDFLAQISYDVSVKQMRLMAQKFLYILDYYVPQLLSEYGGLLNVIAENDEECFDIVVEWDNETWTEYYSKLRENIVRAQRFPLLENEESRVAESFTT